MRRFECLVEWLVECLFLVFLDRFFLRRKKLDMVKLSVFLRKCLSLAQRVSNGKKKGVFPIALFRRADSMKKPDFPCKNSLELVDVRTLQNSQSPLTDPVSLAKHA